MTRRHFVPAENRGVVRSEGGASGAGTKRPRNENVARSARIGVQKLVLQPERVDKRSKRLSGEKTLRAKLEAESVLLLRCR